MFDEFFSKAYELLKQGLPFVTATVVRAEKPTSAKPGDKAIVTSEGVMHGWIGGSCAQPTVIELAMKALADGEPRFVRLSTDPEAHNSRDGLMDLPMTCFSGGTLEIYIEPHLPPPRLMIIGNLPVAQALIRLGRAMNYHTIAIDPDNEGAGLEQANEIITNLEKIPARITALTYVVVATHGRYDELALAYALRSKAAYVALVASKTRSAAVLDYLAAQGLSQEELARLKYPAGLDIQALRGDEIAVSIMAEIVQRRRNADPIDVHALLPDTTVEPESTEAIDPVCGMSVQIANAEHQTEYREQTYYFCCQGCQETFEDDPEKFVAMSVPSGDAIDPICGMTVDIASAKYMSEYAGQFYYFCAAGCKVTFDKSPEDYVKQEAVSGSASG